jgi:sec-independent protein translocase protein TatA
MELLLVLGLALLVLGPERLPGAGRALGRGLREFKDAIAGAGRADDPDAIAAGGDAARRTAESSAAA